MVATSAVALSSTMPSPGSATTFSGNQAGRSQVTNPSTLTTTAPDIAREGMTYIPGGTFQLGLKAQDNGHSTIRDVTVGPYFIDTFPVTNRQFAQFVDQAGYVTKAERGVSAREFPTIGFNSARPGALQYRPARSSIHANQWE